MTELLIDGVAVVLPTGMSIAVKRENPLFTKNGEYTYELELELSNAVNAKLYEHLNRLNSISEVRSKRKAVLIADNRVYCNGTEIITGWTDDTVKIQVASGNSELNYFIGSDLLIYFLKMPTSSPLTGGKPDQKWIRKKYPEIDFCLSPIVNRSTGVLINEWFINMTSATKVEELSSRPSFEEYEYLPQPFLCAYIREVLKGIGYELTENQIESTIWKDLCICHAEKTYEWAKMLPGWRVRDFLEETEKFFNGIFVIDARARTARFILNNSYYLNSGISHVKQVTDEYEAECDEDTDNSFHRTANIAYSLPDNNYYQHRRLAESIAKNAKKDVIAKEWIATQPSNYLSIYFDTHKFTDVLVTDESTGREYIYLKDLSGRPRYLMVNEFKSVMREESTNTIELQMIPAEMDYKVLYYRVDGEKRSFWNWQWPTVESGETNESGETITNIEELINTGIKEKSETRGAIYLAFHQGLVADDPRFGAKNLLPMPYTDEYLQADDSYVFYKTNSNGNTLRLVVMQQSLYDGMYDIDGKRPIKIISHDPNLYDTRGVFEINNKRYVCKDIEYTLTANGRKKEWTGTFYPIKISDTESYQRWILADGKWRDGGVWLDNGRWLDE
ncbi:MAG: hypothetical protein RSH25_13645 [Bacteroides sp.]|uniref:hypothetical protein n=1 Tax=Bacteroides sp. TaxID=29523 RepID=UPI002FC5A5B8